MQKKKRIWKEETVSFTTVHFLWSENIYMFCLNFFWQHSNFSFNTQSQAKTSKNGQKRAILDWKSTQLTVQNWEKKLHILFLLCKRHPNQVQPKKNCVSHFFHYYLPHIQPPPSFLKIGRFPEHRGAMVTSLYRRPLAPLHWAVYMWSVIRKCPQ